MLFVIKQNSSHIELVLSNDRDVFGWANLRVNLGLHKMFIDPPDCRCTSSNTKT